MSDRVFGLKLALIYDTDSTNTSVLYVNSSTVQGMNTTIIMHARLEMKWSQDQTA